MKPANFARERARHSGRSPHSSTYGCTCNVASLVTSGNLIIAYSALGYAKLARTSFLTVNTSTWVMLVDATKDGPEDQ